MAVKSAAVHTPGPWSGDTFGNSVFAHGEDMKICDIRGWGHLTGVGGLRLSDDDAIAVQKANQALIAAAPDLLAAARLALDEMRHTVAPRNSFTDAVDALDAAITKAESPKP